MEELEASPEKPLNEHRLSNLSDSIKDLNLRNKKRSDSLPMNNLGGVRKGSFLEEDFFMTPRGQDKTKEEKHMDKKTMKKLETFKRDPEEEFFMLAVLS